MPKERTTKEKVIMEELLLPFHPSHTHTSPSQRGGIAEGAGRAGLFHREEQVSSWREPRYRQGQHPSQWGTAPQHLSWESRTGDHYRPRKVRELRNKHGNNRAQGRTGCRTKDPDSTAWREICHSKISAAFPVSYCSLPGTGNAGLLFPSFQWHDSPKASHCLTITSNLWEGTSLVC